MYSEGNLNPIRVSASTTRSLERLGCKYGRYAGTCQIVEPSIFIAVSLSDDVPSVTNRPRSPDKRQEGKADWNRPSPVGCQEEPPIQFRKTDPPMDCLTPCNRSSVNRGFASSILTATYRPPKLCWEVRHVTCSCLGRGTIPSTPPRLLCV